MPDPTSVVAVAAAVGGIAGKIAEKAWERAEGWLSERYGTHTDEVRQQARINSAEFVGQLADRVRLLEASGRITADQTRSNRRDPQLNMLLQQSVLDAAQTSDSLKHELLAAMVAERMATATETTFALASPLALTAIARSTQRQLRLLGVMCYIDEVQPKHLSSPEHFQQWLQIVLRRFADFEFHDIDARHLVALACVTYDPGSARDLSLVLNMKALHIIGVVVPFDGVDGFAELQRNWTEVLGGVRLTSVGSIVGGQVLNQILGTSMPAPQWK